MIIIPATTIAGKICPSTPINEPNFGVASNGVEFKVFESAAELQAYLDSMNITIDVT
jgi:hypothetical protein